MLPVTHIASCLLKRLAPLMLALATLAGYGQEKSLQVTGRITTGEDRAAVAHATISVDHKGIATAANSSGQFALIVPNANFSDTLKISCIGYKTKYLVLSTLENGKALAISLEKSVTNLGEVSVAYYDPVKVIAKAIARIPDNYINRPHVLRGFYRLYTFTDTVPLQLSEAVFDVYNFGYADKHADQFKLMKASSERNERDFKSIELGQKPNSVFECDIVNHRPSSGFLSDKGLTKHVFKGAGITDFQGYQAFEIEFTEKRGLTEDVFRGRMFIDTKTYAFIGFDFGLSPSALATPVLDDFTANALVRTGGADARLLKNHSKVMYQQVGQQWVLASVTGDHRLSFTGISASALDANVQFDYQVTAVDTAPKSSFSSKLGRNENISDHYTGADPKFWKDYNILLADFDTEAIYTELQGINKVVKAGKK